MLEHVILVEHQSLGLLEPIDQEAQLQMDALALVALAFHVRRVLVSHLVDLLELLLGHRSPLDEVDALLPIGQLLLHVLLELAHVLLHLLKLLPVVHALLALAHLLVLLVHLLVLLVILLLVHLLVHDLLAHLLVHLLLLLLLLLLFLLQLVHVLLHLLKLAPEVHALLALAGDVVPISLSFDVELLLLGLPLALVHLGLPPPIDFLEDVVQRDIEVRLHIAVPVHPSQGGGLPVLCEDALETWSHDWDDTCVWLPSRRTLAADRGRPQGTDALATGFLQREPWPGGLTTAIKENSGQQALPLRQKRTLASRPYHCLKREPWPAGLTTALKENPIMDSGMSVAPVPWEELEILYCMV